MIKNLAKILWRKRRNTIKMMDKICQPILNLAEKKEFILVEATTGKGVRIMHKIN